MTSGSYMGIIGVYLMLFGMLKESEPLNWFGLILATIGYFVTAHCEDQYKDRIKKLENKIAKPYVVIHKTGIKDWKD